MRWIETNHPPRTVSCWSHAWPRQCRLGNGRRKGCRVIRQWRVVVLLFPASSNHGGYTGKLDSDFHGTSYWTCGASSHSDRLVFTPTTVGNTRSVKPCRLVSVCACAIPCPCLGSSLPSDLHRHRLHPHPTTSVQALTAEFRKPFQACPSNPELISRREDEKKRSQVHRQSGRLWKRPCT